MKTCKLCNKKYREKHFNQKLCSTRCKSEQVNLNKSKYRHSDKGRAALLRWYNNPSKKIIDQRYNKSDKGRKKAVERIALLLKKDPYVLYRKRLGQTAPYRRLRKELVSKYKKCKRCKSKKDLTIDHIIPMRHGGKHDLKNIQILCRPCNSRKGRTEDAQLSKM